MISPLKFALCRDLPNSHTIYLFAVARTGYRLELAALGE